MRGDSVGHRYIIRTRPFILSIFLILLIFEDVISHLIRPIQLAIILTLYYIAHVIRRGKIRRKDGLIVLIVIALLTIGFRGNFNSKIQNNSILCIFDAFNIFKFIGAILGAQFIFDHYRFKELLIEYTSFMVKLAVAISTICMILNFFANIGMHTDYRAVDHNSHGESLLQEQQKHKTFYCSCSDQYVRDTSQQSVGIRTAFRNSVLRIDH